MQTLTYMDVRRNVNISECALTIHVIAHSPVNSPGFL